MWEAPALCGLELRRHAGARAAVLMVSGVGADAEAARALRPTGGPPGEFGVTGRALPGSNLGGDWIGQKKDKSGERETAKQNRPVPHVQTEKSSYSSHRGRVLT